MNFVEADAVTIKWFILSNAFVHQIDRTVKENCNYFWFKQGSRVLSVICNVFFNHKEINYSNFAK